MSHQTQLMDRMEIQISLSSGPKNIVPEKKSAQFIGRWFSGAFKFLFRLLYYSGLLFTLFFIIRSSPQSVPVLSWLILAAVLAMVIFPTIGRSYSNYRHGIYSRSRFLTKTAIDLAGLALTVLPAIFLAGVAANWIRETVVNATQSSSPEFSTDVGIFCALATAAVVGFSVGSVIRAVWGRIIKAPS